MGRNRKPKRELSPEQVDKSALDAVHKMAAALKDVATALNQRVMVERDKLGIMEEQLAVSEESLEVQKRLAVHSEMYEAMLHQADEPESGGELQ